MASARNPSRASCIGTLSFPINAINKLINK